MHHHQAMAQFMLHSITWIFGLRIKKLWQKLYMIFYAVWTNESGYDKYCGRKDSAAYSSSCAGGSDVIERPLISITSGEEFRRPRMS